MTKVYVVEGQDGDYEDYRTWVSAIFDTQDKAETYLARINEWIKREKDKVPEWYDGTKRNPYDGMNVSVLGSAPYYIYEMDLRTDMPQEIKGEK